MRSIRTGVTLEIWDAVGMRSSHGDTLGSSGANAKRTKWDGGYVRREKSGRLVFVIERWVNGKKFHISTRTHTRRAALKQLDRFEADPRAYRPDGNDLPLPLTPDLVKDFFKHLLKERGATSKYAREMARHLGDWAVDLNGKNLRTLQLADVRAPLEGRSNRQHRIIALKGFCRWLRQDRGLLRTAQDITLEVPVPQGSPEKYQRRKVVEIERIEAAFSQLEGAPRDFLLVMASTGMHVTELERFVRGQLGAELLDGDPAVLVTRHKSGASTRIPLAIPEVVEAARRLRAGAVVPRKLNQQVKDACLRAKVKPFTLGVMRHTVATYAVNAGSPAELVSKFLGHRDKRTTERFYVDLEKPTAGVPVPGLRLVQGA